MRDGRDDERRLERLRERRSPRRVAASADGEPSVASMIGFMDASFRDDESRLPDAPRESGRARRRDP